IGYLTDVLVLRADLTDNPTLGTLLDRTRDDVLTAFAHQGIPFEELAARLRVVRDPARTPLFQTMAILHTEDAEHAADAFAGLRTSTYDGGFEQAKFDLMLEAWQDDDGLLVTFVYDAEIFDAATIERMTERFARLLRALPDHTTTPFAAVPILGPDDTTVLDGPRLAETPTFLDQFAEQVRLRPDAIALTCGDQHLTYAQLDTRARDLATALPHHTVIGIRLGRTTDAIAAMIATWYAHSAYLPLDPDYPQARLDYMTHDSGAALVLTPDGPTPGTTTTPTTTTDTAYLIYTSGSTGTPKGVTVPHTALATRTTWMRQEYGLQPGDRIIQFASHSFDTHVEEIFPALASGARITLLPDGPLTLTDHLTGTTVLDLPTAYWHHLVDDIHTTPWPTTLRLVILGGEQAHETALTRWHHHFADRIRLVNTYGPTEATVIA
ncbi:AMP-binding protein, partial [Streptomyces sp. NPDC004031]